MDISSIISFALYVVTSVGIYAILTLGLNIQWGYSALLNIGISGFYAIGAYVTVYMTAAVGLHVLGGAAVKVYLDPLAIQGVNLAPDHVGVRIGRGVEGVGQVARLGPLHFVDVLHRLEIPAVVPRARVGLLAAGARVNARDAAGWTALMSAALQRNTDVVTALLDHGANTNSKDKEGRTALMWAAGASGPGQIGVVKALLAKGAEVNSNDKEGRTALMWAAVKGHANTAIMLMEQGADVNAKNTQGRTPLMLAAEEHYKDIVTALLAKGAKVNAKDVCGLTALRLARSSCRSYIPRMR